MADTETRLGVVVLGGNVSNVKEGKSSRPLEGVDEFKSVVGQLPPGVEISEFININFGDSIDRTLEQQVILSETLAQLQPSCDATLVMDGADALCADAAVATYTVNRTGSIIFVGSVDEIGVQYGDAAISLDYSIRGARGAHQRQINQVLVLGGINKGLLHLGTRVEHGSDFNGGALFYSSSLHPIAEQVGEDYVFNDRPRKRIQPEVPPPPFLPQFDSQVKTIDLLVGYNSGRLSGQLLYELQSRQHRAIIMTSPEAGRLPKNWLEIVDFGIPVIIQTDHVESLDPDQRVTIQSQEAIQRGAISTFDMSHTAAWVKTLLILGNNPADLSPEVFKEQFYRNFGDITTS